MDRLIAVVTGGTRGIGLGIAGALAERKAAVAISYLHDDEAAHRAEEQLMKLSGDENSVLVLKGDVGDPEAVKEQYGAVVERFGNISVLVNNAGIISPKSVDQITPSEWNETMSANLSSAFYWSSLVIPAMKKARFGRIVNISSIAAHGGGVVGAHYAASKAGMLGLTRYVARELGEFGITVNAIAPAFIEDAGIFTAWSEEEKEELRNKVVVPRIGRVSDVVRAFEYLLDTSFVTGVTLDVNGGTFML